MHDKVRSTKFESKSLKGILVGYVPNGYKVWMPEICKFITARDVVVDEVSCLITRPKGSMQNENEANEVTEWLKDVNKLNNEILTDKERSGEKVTDKERSGENVTDKERSDENLTDKERSDKELTDEVRSDEMKLTDKERSAQDRFG